ncbi:metal ABC transporter permease [Rubellimicrobium aerolatum]|uniref:High-affinity zinc uptake system membrane protein ZnuB n=1 Tax=Rubellimicrobium aerolatum TaxID=490979 RepID=A0ABW0SEB7_9RHOB|nr:metal ABC transporter permease [Rubellimicrobium aerolatum]MBP1805668.1 zinc transport system permease protein [Rubellimicrobium aerolatum]
MSLDPFLIRAALAGLGVALAAGLLGCFVVWRRMAYFGDATAHAGVLGVALALGLGLPLGLGLLGVAGAMAFLAVRLTDRTFGADSALGVLAHGALGVGLFAAALTPGPRMDLEAVLFGDVLTVGWGDLGLIWAAAAGVAGLIWWNWGLLLTSTLAPDLARAGGMDPRRGSLLLALLVAGLVAVAIQVVGALLVTALLILPAAAARGLARTPEGMAVAACALAAVAALGGLGLAVAADSGVGPATVTVAAGLFAALAGLGRLRRGGPVA